MKIFHIPLAPYDDALSPRLATSSYPSAGAMVCMIDRPNVKNAVDRETASALHSAFVVFANDASLRVGILTGSNGSFCAGADLKSILSSNDLPAPSSDADKKEEGKSNLLDPNMDAIAPMGVTRLAMNKPVIAAIEGFAVAGGLELALWADLRVASQEAKLGVLCRLRGVPLIDGGTVRLPALVGGSRAMDLSLTGRLVDAEEALAIGLVNYVVPPSECGGQSGFSAVVEKSLRIAAGLAANPQSCMLNDRESMLDALYPGSAATAGEEEGEASVVDGKVDLRLKGGLRKAMQREFELGLQSLEKLFVEGQVGAFVNRSKEQREADRAKSSGRGSKL